MISEDLARKSRGLAATTTAQVASTDSTLSSLREIDDSIATVRGNVGKLNEAAHETSSSILETPPSQ